ncbi:hypothetical protein V1477_008905 [Vespula maculifrons]|uniref:Uncharacterized protein n=1 Tax=Vespula maculifrons TaxID=7453 RepID=A0ABD2CEC9_VESMC
MALKEEEAVTKKKLIEIRYTNKNTLSLLSHRCCTHSHKSMESSVKTLAPICETTDLCKLVRFIRYFLKTFVLLTQRMKRSGGDTVPLGGDIRRPPLTNETGWWGYCATWRRYKAAAIDSAPNYATNFHHSHMNPCGTHALQGKEKSIWVQSCHEFPPITYESSWYACSASKREGMKRGGGDTLPPVK